LFGGAILYLPLVTFLVARFGFKRATVTALLGPLPFAFMDAWGWAGASAPNFLQFIPVLLVTSLLGAGLHFVYLFIAARWPARATFIQSWPLETPQLRESHTRQRVMGELISPVPQQPVATPLAIPEPTPEPQQSANEETLLAVAAPTPHSEPEPSVAPAATPEIVEAPETVIEPEAVAKAEPVTAPEPFIKPVSSEEIPEKLADLEVMESKAEAAPELVPLPRVNESAPPKLVSIPEVDSGKNEAETSAGGPPVWMFVVGLGVVIVVGIVLIVIAFR
jgi:hypothetical protein